MIEGFDYDDHTEAYTLRIDPRWHAMYCNREFALIDWDKRREFGRNQDMAKTLQRLVATSSDRVQRYALDGLKAKMEYTSPLRKFRDALGLACTERSEEHTSELQSLMRISYAVFCLKKKKEYNKTLNSNYK